MSKEVTEVSESFRLGRGGGGLIPVPGGGGAGLMDGKSVGTGRGGGGSFLNEALRSMVLFDAVEGDLLGAGGAGGKLLLIDDFSSDFLSSELMILF